MPYLTGFHAIEERIRSGVPAVALLAANAGPRAREIMSLATASKIPIARTGKHELDRLAPDNRGIALEVVTVLYGDALDGDASAGINLSVESFLEGLGSRKNALAVILDEVTDPHNYGAILRSCDQFGADVIITRSRRIAGKGSAVAAQASAGAVAWAPVAQEPNLPRAASLLKDEGFWVYGADMSGSPLYETDLSGRTALVFGGEGGGISRLLASKCDAMLAIPHTGHIDSLNVSVAAGIFLYEARRAGRRAAGGS
jgi:23S rRNA (guanosine2251-2'-O)-methyltransferase